MNEDSLTPRLQQELAEALLRERAGLRRTTERLASAERELSESQGAEGDGRGAPADVASDLVEATVDLALEHAERERLAAVETALRRIAEGSYGTCESCGGPISTDRLYAQPWASLCIRCAEHAAGAGVACLVMGSVTAEVLHQASVPVLVARPTAVRDAAKAPALEPSQTGGPAVLVRLNRREFALVQRALEDRLCEAEREAGARVRAAAGGQELSDLLAKLQQAESVASSRQA